MEKQTERFWKKVDRCSDDGCWEWMGCRYPSGYGVMRLGGKNRKASRISWELANGAIPEGKYVCHSCNNPPCVNPAHLFLGTHTDNMRHRDECGRTLAKEKHPRHKLTQDQVAEIRRRYTGKHGEQTALAREYGVTNTTIKWVVSGGTWEDAEYQPVGRVVGVRNTPSRTGAKGEKHSGSKLTEADVQEMRRRYAAGGVRYEDLAVEFGVSRSIVCRIVKRQLWSHIE